MLNYFTTRGNGYNSNYNMSNNAIDDYKNGYLPKTKFKIIFKFLVNQVKKSNNSFKPDLSKFDFNEDYSSWHHVAKNKRKVYFYKLNDVIYTLDNNFREDFDFGFSPKMSIAQIKQVILNSTK